MSLGIKCDFPQYPLIHTFGEDGFQFYIKRVNPATGQPAAKGKVSPMDYYAYRLMKRPGKSDHLLRSGHLLSQYVVDQYAKVESERLLWIRLHQKELRVESYNNLRDAVLNDNIDPGQLGTRTILPSTFTGSPRYMHERAMDALRYCQVFGLPDLFITVTANPDWIEIKRELYPGQQTTERQDIVARVFRQKIERLKDLLYTVGVFGRRVANIASVEWQKKNVQ